MLIEEIELTLANVDLGCLSEFAAMVLFANAFCRRIVRGTLLAGIHQIRDAAQRPLYPAKFMTHLRVPSTCLLDEFSVWDRVEVGVDVQSFGRMMLDSVFLLSRPGEIPPDSKLWNSESYPSMHAGTLFIIEGQRTEPEASMPREGHLAEMPALSAPPPAVAQFGKVQSRGGALKEYDGRLVAKEPISYRLIAGRDASPGHAVMFATFIRILDIAERQFLSEGLFPPFHESLIDHRQVLERQTFYLGNCSAGDMLRIDLRGKLLSCPPTLKTRSMELAPVGILELVFEVYQETTKALLVVSQVKKLLVVPRAMKTIRREAERVLYQYGQET